MKRLIFISLSIIYFSIYCFCQSGESKFKTVYISKVPKPTAPASLVVSEIKFSDKKGNNNDMLDANESSVISFIVSNKGKGDAYNLVVNVEEQNNIKGILYSKSQSIDNLMTNSNKLVEIPINGSMQIVSGKANFYIVVKEGNGFDADPFVVSFKTQEFKTPKITIADALFSNVEGEGKIKLGQIVNLKMKIQNQGQGEGSDIKIKVTNPNNVYPADKTEYEIKKLKPNESMTIAYEFFANKQYIGSDIPLQISISESYGKYGSDITKTVSLAQTLSKTQLIDINAKPDEQVKITSMSLLSDVDMDIPETYLENKKRYALIIGNEDYSSFQPSLNTEANVEYARNDAKVFMMYCQKTLGIPEENITLIYDATVGRMNQNINRINKLLKNSNGNLEIIFYYAGHGLPDEKTHEPFLVPVDINGSDLQNAIKLTDIYNSFTEYPSKRISIFLDACFSGGGRNQGLVSARGVKIRPKENVLKGNVVVFSACSGEETSLPYKDQQHGLFTYYLLKKIKESKGEVSYKELSEFLKEEVSFESVKKNNKEQHPQINTGSDVFDTWGKWKLQ